MQSTFQFRDALSTVTAVNILGPIIESWNRSEKNAIIVHKMYDAAGNTAWPTPRPSIYHDLDVEYNNSATAVSFEVSWKHVPTEEETLRLSDRFASIGFVSIAEALHP